MQEFIFRMLDDGTFGAAGYSGDETSVHIPEVYNGQPVTMLLDDLFKGHAEIEQVIIPDTVTDIGGFVLTDAKDSSMYSCRQGCGICGSTLLPAAGSKRS